MRLWLLATLFAIAGCGSSPQGIGTCEAIEYARCERGPACISGFVGSVDSCKSFYQVQCQRGLALTTQDPGSTLLNKCLADIAGTGDAVDAATSCEAVIAPENDPNCGQFVSPIGDATTTDSDAAEATDAVDAADADVADSLDSVQVDAIDTTATDLIGEIDSSSSDSAQAAIDASGG
jgi:hypothetical protein